MIDMKFLAIIYYVLALASIIGLLLTENENDKILYGICFYGNLILGTIEKKNSKI